MIQGDNYEGNNFPSVGYQKANIETPNFNPESSNFSQNVSEADCSSNFQSFDQQKRLSWLDCSVTANRTTASNSTEFQIQNSTILFNNFGEKQGDQNKFDNISVQNAVFSEESSCSSCSSRTQSQDFTPFLNVLAEKKNSAICQLQSDDWSQEKSSSNIQNNKEEFTIDQQNLNKQQSSQSENILMEYQKQDKILNQNELVHEHKHLDPLVIEEIKRINQQENEDETHSPTLKLKRILAERENSLEQRIHHWLDMNGVFQVDPSIKREEYYSLKRESLIKVRKVSKPLEEVMKSSTGCLNLCKISSSPLFSRRQQVKQIPVKKKNFLEINDENDDEQQICQDNQIQLEKQPICTQSQETTECYETSKQTNKNLIKNFNNSKENKNYEISIHIQDAQQDIYSSNLLAINNNFEQDNSSQNPFKIEEQNQVNQADSNKNNILPKKKVKPIHELSLIQGGGITYEKELKQIETNSITDNESHFNQENCDFINKRPIPNLDIDKNQKRKSLKSMNSIPSLNAMGNFQ